MSSGLLRKRALGTCDLGKVGYLVFIVIRHKTLKIPRNSSQINTNCERTENNTMTSPKIELNLGLIE